MKETDFCPYCDELVELDITEEYYVHEQGDEVERIDCPKCEKPISISWEIKHRIRFDEV